MEGKSCEAFVPCSFWGIAVAAVRCADLLWRLIFRFVFPRPEDLLQEIAMLRSVRRLGIGIGLSGSSGSRRFPRKETEDTAAKRL